MYTANHPNSDPAEKPSVPAEVLDVAYGRIHRASVGLEKGEIALRAINYKAEVEDARKAAEEKRLRVHEEARNAPDLHLVPRTDRLQQPQTENLVTVINPPVVDMISAARQKLEIIYEEAA